MINAVQLDILLKVERDYVAGTDLFQSSFRHLTEAMGAPPAQYEISFHRMAHRKVQLSAKPDAKADRNFGHVIVQSGTEKQRYSLIETDDDLPVERRMCCDKVVGQNAVYSNGTTTATIQAMQDVSDIDVVIALIKAMHQTLFPDADGQWVFARAKMKDYSLDLDAQEYWVTLSARLGTKLTRNEVFIDGKKVGDVFFALM